MHINASMCVLKEFLIVINSDSSRHTVTNRFIFTIPNFLVKLQNLKMKKLYPLGLNYIEGMCIIYLMGIKGMCIIISKLNVYGAIDNTTGLRSISAVVQNDYGVFMGALAMQSPCGISIIAKEL